MIAEQPGVLGDAAAAVLMKILYGARMGRYDLIRPVQALASRIRREPLRLARPCRLQPGQGGNVPGVTGEDNPHNTPTLSTDASMGVASHPEVSKPAGQGTQSAPADASGVKSPSPSQGAKGGNNGGNGGGVEDDAPTSPADEPPGGDDPMDGNNAGGGGPSPPGDDGDPPDPDDPDFGPESEYFAAAESADACIVVHYVYRRAGYSPAVAAWRNGAWPKRLLRPDEVETALALPLWQELTEDAFFQMLDDASAIDRRFGESTGTFCQRSLCPTR